MQPFPPPSEPAGLYQGPTNGHVGIEVADVVDVRFAFQHGQPCAEDSLKRGIGHRQDDVAIYQQGIRHGQSGIAQVIDDAFVHVETRERGRANPHDPAGSHGFRRQEPPGMAFARVIGRTSAHHRHGMCSGDRVHDGPRDLGGCRSVGRVVEIQ